MGLFGRKKTERPKSTLGLALYQYDNILQKDLKKVLDRINTGRVLDKGKAVIILERTAEKLDGILEDLSKDKLKVDYRSDKIRYKIIDMINKLKNILREAVNNSSGAFGGEDKAVFSKLSEIKKIRDVIKNKMSDIESDYI
jgi:hypothetical protein